MAFLDMESTTKTALTDCKWIVSPTMKIGSNVSVTVQMLRRQP